MDSKQNTRQRYTLVAKKASGILDCIRRSIAIARKSSEVIFPLCSVPVAHFEW